MIKEKLALEEITIAIHKDYCNSDLFEKRAQIEYNLGMSAKAIKDYSMVLKYKTRDSQTRYKRAILYLQTGRVMDAINDLNIVTRQTRRNAIPESWLILGWVMEQINYPAKAAECYDKAVKLMPDSDSARWLRYGFYGRYRAR